MVQKLECSVEEGVGSIPWTIPMKPPSQWRTLLGEILNVTMSLKSTLNQEDRLKLLSFSEAVMSAKTSVLQI